MLHECYVLHEIALWIRGGPKRQHKNKSVCQREQKGGRLSARRGVAGDFQGMGQEADEPDWASAAAR